MVREDRPIAHTISAIASALPLSSRGLYLLDSVLHLPHVTHCDSLMPVTFDSFGVKFLYPDNWTQVDRPEEEGKEGVTLELPSGGFFTIERVNAGELAEELIEEVADSISEEYDEIERGKIDLGGNADRESAVEFRFYYLDLLIISRLDIIELDGMTLVIQMQAESRDFDENERVFAALLQQLRGSA